MTTLNEANNSVKREKIYRKARLILKERKEWGEHRSKCFEAGICPNCGEEMKPYKNVEWKNTFFVYFKCNICEYKYDPFSDKETGRTI